MDRCRSSMFTCTYVVTDLEPSSTTFPCSLLEVSNECRTSGTSLLKNLIGISDIYFEKSSSYLRILDLSLHQYDELIGTYILTKHDIYLALKYHLQVVSLLTSGTNRAQCTLFRHEFWLPGRADQRNFPSLLIHSYIFYYFNICVVM